MFKIHPLGCKCQLLEPDFGKLLGNSPAIPSQFSFAKTSNLTFSPSKTKFKHTLKTSLLDRMVNYVTRRGKKAPFKIL